MSRQLAVRRRSIPPAVAHQTVYDLAMELIAAGVRVDALEYRGITSQIRPYLAGVGVLDRSRSGAHHVVWAYPRDGILYWMLEPRGGL